MKEKQGRFGDRGVNTIVAILALIAIIVALVVIVIAIQYFLAVVIIFAGVAVLVFVKTPIAQVVGGIVLVGGLLDALLVSTQSSLALVITHLPGAVGVL